MENTQQIPAAPRPCGTRAKIKAISRDTVFWRLRTWVPDKDYLQNYGMHIYFGV